MKRVLLATIATVAGLVALLSFKTHGQPLSTQAAGLPAARLPDPSPTATTPSSVQASRTPRRSAGRVSASSSPRTYLGSAIQTPYGIVQVKVTATATGSKITNVSFQQLTAFDGRSQEINSQAAPILLQETLTAQSAHIDTVSGATYTSDGYFQSLQSALDQAGIR
jgi:uncharacterized protein with FMN-binding domain